MHHVLHENIIRLKYSLGKYSFKFVRVTKVVAIVSELCFKSFMGSADVNEMKS